MTLRQFSQISIVTALFAALASGCAPGQAESPQLTRESLIQPLPVEVAAPARSEIFARFATTSVLETDADAPVVARRSGEVVDILVEEGDEVRRGQVLARVDGNRARLAMQEARALLDQSEREFRRMVDLHERGLVSAAAFDGMQFDLEALRAQFELKKLDVEYSTIRATIDGVVSERVIKIGQHLNEGDTTFRVTDARTLIAELHIPQSEIGRVSVGDRAVIRVDAMPERGFDAHVIRVGPTVDARNGTFRATAYVDNREGQLAPGMFARLGVAVEKRDNALVIPLSAVVEEDGQTVVYVVTNGTAERRIVETGIESGDIVEIVAGVSDQDTVVVTGQSTLRDGSRVLASIPGAVPVAG